MKISIITASYNYEKYIKETIESVLNQTYSDWELIIVDDGSSDNSLEVIKSFVNKDNRIKLFAHENNQNKGLKETILLGIKKSESEWIAFLESDDLWREDYLEKKVEIIKQYPGVALVFNDIEMFGDETRIKFLKKPFEKNHKYLTTKTYPRNMFKDLRDSNRILTFSCLLANKEILMNTDFNTPVDKLLDWWLYIHMAYDNEFYYIPEKLTKWRIHCDSYINNRNTRFYAVNAAAYIDIYKKTKPNKKLMLLIILLITILIFKIPRLYWVKLVRFIKKKLGLPLRNSPNP